MRLLVIRTSAMGDVALTTPVLMAMRKQYPEVELVLITRSEYKHFSLQLMGFTFFSLISGIDIKDCPEFSDFLKI
jgi:hypothetical protein